MKSLALAPAGLLLAVLALFSFGASRLQAEEVYVTSYTSGGRNGCGPSCPYGFVTTPFVPNYSIACPVSRTGCLSGTGTSGVWKVTPVLANSHGTYKIFVTKCVAAECSPDIIINLTTTGGTLTDASGAPQTTVPTTAFQRNNSTNCWTLVGYLANNTTQPDVFFTYASGSADRFFMDAVEFQSVDVLPNPTRITQILCSNSVTICGTGPGGHNFALLSATNPAQALPQWTREQTNTDATGTFNFHLAPGTDHARFFRVMTQ